MKCSKCGEREKFFVSLFRVVEVSVLENFILDIEEDDEQLVAGSPFTCGSCGSSDIDAENADIDAFWRIYNRRVRKTPPIHPVLEDDEEGKNLNFPLD